MVDYPLLSDFGDIGSCIFILTSCISLNKAATFH
ncbi:hypothetical protein SLEP1_g25795 [Rubroshorea leprosula]|uniref:Uncharacterized protein n=1 Tax=Rubroshorea leprosula TaxID=152421 RepID=A0AAV5JJW6_9ROSI|nr:hypothetical protein SLEP1_g25795 [Rubroshorea leprosula]